MKRCYIAHAEDKIGTKVYPQIEEQLSENGSIVKPLLVIFTSDNANFGWYSRMLSNSFPEATVIGTTSNVIYSNKGTARTGLTVLAVTMGVSVTSGLLFEASRYPKRSADSIRKALNGFPTDNSVCLEFNASAENCEELIMDTFRDIMKDTGIPLVGCSGSTAENPDRPSAVSLNGILYMDTCAFVLIHNEMGKISIVKENMFKPTKHFFIATDVDCDARKVYEFDHKGATGVVANALAIPEDELSANTFFHPLGRIEDGDLSIVGVRELFPDNSMSFFSRIYNETRVELLDPIEPVEDVWADTSAKVHANIPEPSFSIIINCFSRMRYFVEQGKFAEYDRSLAEDYGDFIGLSGHGEQFMYKHLNQTMLILTFE